MCTRPGNVFYGGSPARVPSQTDGNWRQGLRSLWDLTRHLTARADDNHAAPPRRPRREHPFPGESGAVQARVRFLAYHRIKPHVPPLVRAPVNSFEFHRCRRSCMSPRTSEHRLRRGLPGYLILFATRALVLQRQSQPGKLPSLSEF